MDGRSVEVGVQDIFGEIFFTSTMQVLWCPNAPQLSQRLDQMHLSILVKHLIPIPESSFQLNQGTIMVHLELRRVALN